ncbi:MAG: hypothetical protein HY778_05075 [Betaproteobacteria bacterium]|nr:hypothetical protein [Betaproteobacteria bacterium]
MNPRLIELAQRRARLQAQAEGQRRALAEDLAPLARGLQWVDRAREAARWLGRHAHLVAAAALVVAVLRPRRTLRWLRRGFVAWQFARRARPPVLAFMAGLRETKRPAPR